MDFISDAVSWALANKLNFIQGYFAVVGLASFIVKLTPTLKDDDALKGIVKFMGKYIALNTNKGNTP